MLKKLAITAGLVVAAAFLLATTRAGSYASFGWTKIKCQAKRQVPLEVEIERLKHEVTRLVPDMKKHRSAIAEETVAIKNLKEEIVTARGNIETQKAALLKLTRDLEAGETQFVFAGSFLTKDKAVLKLDRDVQAVKRAETSLKSREQLLETKEKALDAAKEQLAAMFHQKDELEGAINQLELELKNVRLAQTKSKFQLDDTRVGEIKQSLRELRTRLDVEKTELEMEGAFPNEAPAATGNGEVKSVTEVTRTAREYLEGAKVAEKK